MNSDVKFIRKGLVELGVEIILA